MSAIDFGPRTDFQRRAQELLQKYGVQLYQHIENRDRELASHVDYRTVEARVRSYVEGTAFTDISLLTDDQLLRLLDRAVVEWLTAPPQINQLILEASGL